MYSTCTPAVMTELVTCHCLEQETVGYGLNCTQQQQQQQLGHLLTHSCVFAFTLSSMTVETAASPLEREIDYQYA